MTEQEARHYMRRRMARAWLGNCRSQDEKPEVHCAKCIAYLENGNICGKPAQFIDPTRGGMVCEEHKPK